MYEIVGAVLIVVAVGIYVVYGVGTGSTFLYALLPRLVHIAFLNMKYLQSVDVTASHPPPAPSIPPSLRQFIPCTAWRPPSQLQSDLPLPESSQIRLLLTRVYSPHAIPPQFLPNLTLLNLAAMYNAPPQPLPQNMTQAPKDP